MSLFNEELKKILLAELYSSVEKMNSAVVQEDPVAFQLEFDHQIKIREAFEELQ